MHTTIHTLVLHSSPDIEVCFMSYVILTSEEVRDRLGVVEHPKMKFISAGDLRKEDWPGEETLVSSALEGKGYLFLDCGGGTLDQHGRPEHQNRNSVSSLGFLTHAVDLDLVAPQLVPIIAVLNRNDLDGVDVAPRRDCSKSSTPHTRRHLRNVVQGLNLLYKDQPSAATRIMHVAFGCIERLVDAALLDLLDEFRRRREQALAAHESRQDSCTDGTAFHQCQSAPTIPDMIRTAGFDFRELFLVEQLLGGAPAYFATIFGIDAHEEIELAVKQFACELESALKVMEQEWREAEGDLRQARKRTVTVQRKTDQGTMCKVITLVDGSSRSTRFGAATRWYKRADVTIQFKEKGKFVIATTGLLLDRVAQVLREADLRKKGVEVTAADRLSFAKPGNLRYADRSGAVHDALFLTEYRKTFGNAFRSNPNSEPTALSRREIVDLTIEALAKPE